MTDYDSWAWLYDRTLGPDYRDLKMGFLQQVLLDPLPPGARVLDLCCGTGQMMAPMVDQGFEAVGLDLSADMLRHAARNVPQADLQLGDARDFTLDRPVAGVVCASASLNHMTGIDDLSRVFSAVFRALESGGIFVFDINHPSQMLKHWRGQPAAGEICDTYAWLITPDYDAASASGAFRVDIYQKPDSGVRSADPAVWGALWRALLARAALRRARLRQLERFGQTHPDWTHRSVSYPIHGHEIDAVLKALADQGFEARAQTLTGATPVDDDSAACFVCRKPASERAPTP